MADSNGQGEWQIVKFGDVVNDVKESEKAPTEAGLERFVGLEHIEPLSLHLLEWGSLLEEEVSFTRRFRKGQVLFAKRRAYQRKVAVAEFDGICSSDILTLQARREKLLPELLPFIVQSSRFFDHALDTSSGSLSPRTRWSQLRDFEFALPTMDEQHRIANLMWAIDHATVAWRGAKERLIALKQAMLDEEFNAERCQADTIWKATKLKTVAELQTGIAKGKKYDGVKTVELPYLRVANVQDGHLELTEMKTIVVAEMEIDRYRVRDNDVLIIEGGDFDKVGRGSIWKSEIDLVLHQNHVFCVRPKPDQLRPEYLSYQTNSRYGKTYFLKCAKKTSNLASINSTQVKNFPLLLPSVDHQHEFVEKLSPIEDNLCRIEAHLKELNSLRNATERNILMRDTNDV